MKVNILLIAALALCACASQKVCDSPQITTEVSALVSPSTLDCGTVNYNKPFVLLARCAVQALKDQRPFRASYGIFLMDSFIRRVLVLDQKGRMFVVYGDCESSCGECYATTYECASAEIKEGRYPSVVCVGTSRGDISFPQ